MITLLIRREKPKQQEQLNVSLLEDTTDNSKDAISALSTGEDITDADDHGDPDVDDTLDTEHDVFKEFIDPDADVLDIKYRSKEAWNCEVALGYS